MDHLSRWRMRLVGLLLVAGSVVYLSLPFFALQWAQLPFTGLFYDPNLVVNDAGDPAWQQVSAYPERLVAIDDQPLASAVALNGWLAGQGVGDEVTLLLTRPGAQSVIADTRPGESRLVTVTLRSFSLADQFGWFWRFYLVGLATLAVGVWTFWARADRVAAQVFALFTLAVAWGVGGLFDALTTHFLIRFWILGLCLAGSLHLVLVGVFPQEAAWVRRWPHLKWAPLIPAGVVAVWAQWWLTRPGDPWAYALPWRWAYIFNGLALLLSIVLLVYRSVTSPSPLVRQQGWLILASAAVAFGPIAVYFLSLLSALSLQAALLPMLIYPVAIGLIIIRYRLLNTQVVLRRTLTYALLFAGYTATVVLLSLTIGPLIAGRSLLLLVLFVLLITISFEALRSRLQRLVDRTFFRKPIAYDALLQSYNQALTVAVTVEQVAERLLANAQMGVPDAAVYLYLLDSQMGCYDAFDERALPPLALDAPLALALQAQRQALFWVDESPRPGETPGVQQQLQALELAVAVPLMSDHQLLGWLALPHKADGGHYEQAELNFLFALAHQTVIALERANVVRRLQMQVDELAMISQFSQALNFTIDFDALLELVYTNCRRVLDVANFAIALRSPETQHVYCAFYVAGDDRLPGREGPDNHVEDGRVLQVLNTGQSLAEVQEGRHWLGAPLNAGAVALGVLYTWEAPAPFTARRQQLFGVLADRTATALDRWLADQKLQRRAQQLETLNEVTRSLTATEQPDALLALILNKAIALLDAAAGSILMVDEDTGDLAFRVVSGPVGQELVGNRLPFGVGLAGTAAQTARPVLVNDVQHDRRWFGEVGSDPAFVTQSSLSVPLLQQRRVVGVLQVINRSNGAHFDEDDQQLLTAFAAQAVVALATAQLLRQTDAVLQARVTELSLRQQMDRDLSTSLELPEVLSRSLTWILRICEGTAGAIALADEEGVLHLRAVQGYDASFDLETLNPDTVQASLLGHVWRYGQPHNCPNVHLEPNYMAGAFNTRSQLTLPIKYKLQRLGVVSIEREVVDGFDEGELETMTGVVAHASSAIANALLYEQVIAANRAKSEFVSMVSHEMKTPITAIRGYADLMLAGVTGELSPPQREFVETISRNTVKMGRLIQDLTDISRIEMGKLQVHLSPTALAPVVSEAVQTTQTAYAAKQTVLHLDLPVDLPLVLGDQQRLVQVMTNLLSNACKYSPAGADVYVTVQPDELLRPDGQRVAVVRCQVRDTGYGISEADRAQLFTKFFRSSDERIRQSPGTGLGLSITKGIVELHGGQIWVESVLGQGTTFAFTVLQAR